MPRRSPHLGLVLLLVGIVAGMVGLTYASVPLYRLFCQLTGYAGEPARAEAAPGAVAGPTITVSFNADVNSALPWVFFPEQKQLSVRLGESMLAFYRAENRSGERMTGTATFNVTPAKAAPYFAKIDCFCFTEQVLQAGQAADLPVSFFVDPAIREDPNVSDLREITLSYMFFRAAGDPGARTSAAAAAAPPAGPGS